LKPDALLRVLPGYDAVLASVETYSAEVFSSPATSQLKIISRWGVGYDAVDLAAATANGIVVTNTPGFLDEAVADYTFALLLALARRIPEGNLAVRNGHWQAHWGCDVAGKTLGLIGCGRIARAVATRAAGFKMRLLAHDPAPNPEAQKLGIAFVPLDDLLAQSDFISLHAALTPVSRGLVGEAQLRRMKPSALLINAGRGALLDEAALTRALRENWIAGAALDVFCEEPLPPDHPFRSTLNLLLTPHQASFARDTGARVSETAAQAILDAMHGRQPRFVVNPEVLKSPNCRVVFHD
jgi:phosphoglycerate dehydrogenase-like enzyme